MAVGVVLYSTGPVLLQTSTLSGPQFSFWRLWIAGGAGLAVTASTDHLPVMAFLLGTIFVAALLVSAFVALAGMDPTRATTTDLALAAAVALGPGLLGHFIMTWPLRYVPANIPPIMRLAQPFIAGPLRGGWSPNRCRGGTCWPVRSWSSAQRARCCRATGVSCAQRRWSGRTACTVVPEAGCPLSSWPTGVGLVSAAGCAGVRQERLDGLAAEVQAVGLVLPDGQHRRP